MDHSECALAYFKQGCNCAQAVFTSFGPEYGLSPEQCMHLTGAFGGGLARRGEMCGAVSGALMVVGLKYGHSPIGDPEAKAEMYEHAQQFIKRFIEVHGTPICRELLGCDISTPEGKQRVHEHNLSQTHCAHFIRSAVELLESF
ncbi:MAG TPA: C-GCAxxG-C-C family protein [Armatimonadota bacterium]|nr:C-GCAxxG-C-C family protein [Armatimonadota bacterium]